MNPVERYLLDYEAEPYQVMDGAAVVNGVTLPQRVINELQRLGIALSWYSPGELRAAVEACAVSEKLIHDDEGVNFFDELVMTEEKQEEDNGDIEMEPARHCTMLHIHPGFQDTLANHRQKKRHNLCEHESDEGCGYGE